MGLVGQGVCHGMEGARVHREVMDDVLGSAYRGSRPDSRGQALWARGYGGWIKNGGAQQTLSLYHHNR